MHEENILVYEQELPQLYESSHQLRKMLNKIKELEANATQKETIREYRLFFNQELERNLRRNPKGKRKHLR